MSNMSQARRQGSAPADGEPFPHPSDVQSLADFSRVLLGLRRREALLRGGAPMTHRELAAKTGWSHGVIGDYLAGKILPPVARLDVLAGLFGATAAESTALAAARERIAAHRRAAGPVAEASATPAYLVPRQLPAEVFGFVGRATQLAALERLAAGDRPARHPTTAHAPAVVISAVSGIAGVGKTALAIHWAHRVADRFPDGQLYVNLRGFEPGGTALSPEEAIHGFLRALGVAPARIPSNLDAQAALYRSILATRRMLVVLDNARDADQVRPLLPGSADCLVVVTSRNQLAGLVVAYGAAPLTIDVLTDGEARELLAARLGAERVAAEPAAVDEIIQRCAGLPLALSIVSARAAVNAGFALGGLADELRQAAGGLHALSAAEVGIGVRAVFSWSYRTLGGDAARLFRLLGLHPGPDITPQAAASLGDITLDHSRVLLAELATGNLLAEQHPGRYTFHDLLRAYAAESAHANETEGERQLAVRRVLTYYLRGAYAAAMVFNPLRQSITLEPGDDDVPVEAFTSSVAAQGWFQAEYPVLLAAIELAASAGFEAHAWQLAWSVADYVDSIGHWHSNVSLTLTALAAARRLGDRFAEAVVRRQLAGPYGRLGRYDDALRCLRDALEGFAALGDEVRQGATQLGISWVYGLQRDDEAALRHAELALDRYRAAGNLPGEAHALSSVGWFHAHLGDHASAVRDCERALQIQQELGDEHGQASTLDNIGFAYQGMGQFAEAVACYERAIELLRALGKRYNVAETLVRLGDIHRVTGDEGAAVRAFTEAVSILEELDHPELKHVRSRLTDGAT